MQLLLLLSLIASTGCFYINYFAFGSNLNPSVLAQRTLTSVESLIYENAFLKDYKLVFDVGAPFGRGPQAASVVPAHGGSTHGVLYRMDPSKFALLLASEGVPLAYKSVSCKVQLYTGSKKVVNAQTLGSLSSIDNGSVQSGKPSRRYIDLILKGAMEQGLDEEYIEYLQSVEVFSESK